MCRHATPRFFLRRVLRAGEGSEMVACPLFLASIGAVIGGGSNYGFQDKANGLDYVELITATITGALTSNRALWPSVTINTAGALTSSTIKGEGPCTGAAGALAGTIEGNRFGKEIESQLNKKINLWCRSEWKSLPLGVWTWNAPSVVPSWSGALGAGVLQENIGNRVKSAIGNPGK